MNTITATRYPATVTELCYMAEAQGTTVSELLAALGPIPMPPAGYALAEGCSDLWCGAEVEAAGLVIVPAWDYQTQERYLELWSGKGTPDESMLQLPPDAARRLAQTLLAAADAVEAGATA